MLVCGCDCGGGGKEVVIGGRVVRAWLVTYVPGDQNGTHDGKVGGVGMGDVGCCIPRRARRQNLDMGHSLARRTD